MSEITLARHRDVTPLTREHAAKLDDIEPHGWLIPHLYDQAAQPAVAPPPLPVLAQMEAELSRAMAPCSQEAAAKAAGLLISGYPQRDDTSAAYASLLARQLARCPPDLLMKVIEQTMDASPDFRPGVGRVGKVVDGVVAKRRRLLLQVQAATRYRVQMAAREAERAAIAAEKVDMKDVQKRLAASLRPPSAPRSAASAAPVEPRPQPKPRHLTGAHLAASRSAIRQK